MKKFIICIYLCVFCCTCFSQTTNDALPKLDNLTFTPHTGAVQYNIQLGKLSDLDFDWLFSLDYLSDGFRPLCYSGIVGENWSLNVSGTITREIIGLPDDVKIKSSASYPSGGIGFLYLLRDSLCAPISKDDVYELPTDSSSFCSFGLVKRPNVDAQSDIYTFSFNGYSGRFIIGVDGEAHIISGDYADIDISGITYQMKNGNPFFYENKSPFDFQPRSSKIRIKTLDGYTYIFGGTLNALGYMTGFSCKYRDLLSEPDITTWHLTTIIAPNNRRLLFHYKADQLTDSVNRLYHNMIDFSHIDDVNFESYRSSIMNIKDSTHDNSFPFWITHTYSAIERCVLLDSITTSDNSYKVIFTYQQLDNCIYEKDYANPLEKQNDYVDFRKIKKNFLQRIQFYTDTILLSDWNFKYQQLNTSNTTRQYLQSLLHYSGLQYNFEYNISTNCPLNNISHVDSMDIGGYWQSNPTFGVLNSICDPMGCTTKLKYSRCFYDSIRIYNEDAISSVLSAHGWYDINSIALDCITRFDKNGNVLSQRKYEYGDYGAQELPSFPRSLHNGFVRDSILSTLDGKSSGILDVDFAIKKADGTYYVFPYVKLFGSCNAKVTYSKVKEYIKKTDTISDLYHTIFYYGHNRDISQIRHIADLAVPDFLGAYSLFSLAGRRAKLVRQEEYDYQGRLCRTIQNTYYPMILDSVMLSLYAHIPNAHIVEWYCGRNTDYAYKFYKDESHLIHKAITDYEINGEYSVKTSYIQDEKQRTIQLLTQQGEIQQFSNYYYPDNLHIDSATNNQYAQGYLQLVEDNQINMPIEEVSGIISNGIYYVTQGQIMLYNKQKIYTDTLPSVEKKSLLPDYNSNIQLRFPTLPYATLKLYIDTKLPLTTYQNLSFVNDTICYDNRYEEVETYRYNSKYRLSSIHPKSGLPTYLIWDEKNLHIVSKLTGKMIETYSYIPYVGIKSVTNTRGITTYYSYDKLGNLCEVYQIVDGKKIVLQAQYYHYSTQSL